MTERLDKLLVARGLAGSRERAHALILAGRVLVADQVCDKAGTRFAEDVELRLKGEDIPFVSRGGLKLEGALEAFQVDVAGKVALDVGASTGGFTDCLLQHGAARVFAVDVGYGQLAWKLRTDPRVVVLERTNICAVTPEMLGVAPDIAVIDCSFTSLVRVAPPTLALLAPRADVIALIKPQFEVGKGKVGKGGIVRDPALRAQVVEDIRQAALQWGCDIRGVIESPITGVKGNVEYLIHLTCAK